MIKHMLLVFIGGGAGSVMRYSTSLLSEKFMTISFPLATLMVNGAGCFIIGLLSGIFLKNNQTDTKLLLITGFCGGFTTFSAFAQENLNLIQTNQITIAMLYTGLSILLGLALVWLGLFITK
jgi:CrcB protein